MAVRDVQVYDNQFGAFSCDNTTVPYAGGITCTLSHAVSAYEFESGQPLQFYVTVFSSSLPMPVSAPPVTLYIYNNPSLRADILAGNCSQPEGYGSKSLPEGSFPRVTCRQANAQCGW